MAAPRETKVEKNLTRLLAPIAAPFGMVWLGWIGFLFLALASGCSVRQYAVNKLGDALGQSGATFASDDDPELIRQAAPFSLKLMESVLAESPRHTGLLLAADRGFTQYAFAFLQQDADELEDRDLAAANQLRDRARRLYLRARNYGLRSLEVHHRGFEKSLRANPSATVRMAKAKEVPLLYWTAVSWGAAIALSKDNPDLVADLPIVGALVDRALELNEAFDHGSLHTFLISFEAARKGQPGDPEARIQKHFNRAMELSRGQQAAPLVALAETVSIQKQDLAQFKSLLERALAIDVDAQPEWRLENRIMQRRARWLLGRTDQLFLILEPKEENAK